MTLIASQKLQQKRYTIQKRLGRGGMGTVYLATDRNLPGQLVAIKENDLSSAKAQAQFQREAMLLASLKHPNLPRVTDHFVEPSGHQYLAMDYIEGEDLSQVLRRSADAAQSVSIQESEVLSWIDQVLQALDYMHNWVDPASGQPQPILHRDIKPNNIKRTPSGQIFLVDFGLARPAADAATRTGARGSTPGYSPVEQYAGGTDERSDIYSLGATLYKLLTGTRPPPSTEVAAGVALASPRSLNPQISRRTEKIILRAMQTRPDDRYQSVQEMAQALNRRKYWSFEPRSTKKVQTASQRAAGAENRTDRRQRAPFFLTLTFLLAGILLIGSIGYTALLTTRSAPEDTVSSNSPTALQEPSPTSPLPTWTNTPTVGILTVAEVVSATQPAQPVPTAKASTEPLPTPKRTVHSTLPPPTSRPAVTPTPSPVPAPQMEQETPTVTLTLLQPPHGVTTRIGDTVAFVWETTYLPPVGQTFEVVLWGDGSSQNALEHGKGLVDVRHTQPQPLGNDHWQLTVALPDTINPGSYRWGILIVQIEQSYQRFIHVGGASLLHVAAQSNRNSSRGFCEGGALGCGE